MNFGEPVNDALLSVRDLSVVLPAPGGAEAVVVD